jgi:hypothetical protein
MEFLMTVRMLVVTPQSAPTLFNGEDILKYLSANIASDDPDATIYTWSSEGNQVTAGGHRHDLNVEVLDVKVTPALKGLKGDLLSWLQDGNETDTLEMGFGTL